MGWWVGCGGGLGQWSRWSTEWNTKVLLIQKLHGAGRAGGSRGCRIWWQVTHGIMANDISERSRIENGNQIGSGRGMRRRRSFRHVMPFRINLIEPGTVFSDPLRSSETLEVKITFESRAWEGKEIVNHKADGFRDHIKTENPFMNARCKDQKRVTPKVGLEGDANIFIHKTKICATKRYNEGEIRDTRWRMNRSGESGSDLGSEIRTPRLV
jgi:hypothetical protein